MKAEACISRLNRLYFYEYALVLICFPPSAWRTSDNPLSCKPTVQIPTFKRVRLVSAYVVAGILMFVGVMGLLFEAEKGMPSSRHFYGYVLAVVLVTSGALIWIGARRRYGGGPWSVFGIILVAAAISASACLLELQVRHRPLAYPLTAYEMLAVFWGVSAYCLAYGHIRHCARRRMSGRPDSSAPVPSKPS